MDKRIKVVLLLLAVAMAGVSLGGYMLFFGSGEKEIKFKYDDSAFVNPLMGYAPDGRNEDLCEDASLVYAYITWAELEEKEGEYNWENFIEKYNLRNWKNKGKRLVFRFVCDYPTDKEHLDIPGWLYEKTGDGEFYTIEYGSGYCPDYNNEVFILEHEKVIAEIGRFFREDMGDFLAYVELGSLGHWGEWHTYYPAGLPMIPETSVRAKYVDAYEKAFGDVRLLMRRPFAERPVMAGVYNDMTGEESDTGTFINWINYGGNFESSGETDAIAASPEIWNYAPVGGEFSSATPMSLMLTDNLSVTEKLISDSHMTFIGPKVPDVRRNIELTVPASEILGLLGYRYWISSMKIGKVKESGQKEITLTVKNSGAAPIYYDWKLCLYVMLPEDGLSQQENVTRYELDLDLRTITGNMEKECSVNIPKAVFDTKGAKIYIGIENPSTQKPEVFLAMQTKRQDFMSLLWER